MKYKSISKVFHYEIQKNFRERSPMLSIGHLSMKYFYCHTQYLYEILGSSAVSSVSNISVTYRETVMKVLRPHDIIIINFSME